MKKPIPFGKYLLLERVNVGGMAEVFKAKAFGVEGFERLVAVKRILPSIAEDSNFIDMFVDEAKIAGQLSHAQIAQIFDLGRVSDDYFIAMEFVHGKDLRAIFDRARKRGESVSVPMACYAIMKICEGLDYAHNKRDSSGRSLNLVHRDVSPQNLLVSYDGEIKIIDFGIAKATNSASKTQAGILKGKFGYMSPEQVRGLPLDRRSDVFSVGIVLYELLTGERLFVGESDFSTLEKVRKVDIMPPSTYNRRIPDELETIILKALAKDPEDRYSAAMDLHDDLQSFIYTSGNFFARKDLSAYMSKTFADEIAKETARDEEYRKLSAPDAGGTGLDAFDDLGTPKAKPTIPAKAASLSRGVPPLPPKRSTMLGVGGAAPPPPPPQDAPRASAPPNPPGPSLDMDWDEDELATQIYDKPEFSGLGALGSLGQGALSNAPSSPPSVLPPSDSPRNSALEGAPSPFDLGPPSEPEEVQLPSEPAPAAQSAPSLAVEMPTPAPVAATTSSAKWLKPAIFAAALVVAVLLFLVVFGEKKPGYANLETEPRDAVVTVNGERVGVSSPFQLQLAAGERHRIEVSAPGLSSWSTELQVDEGETRQLPKVELAGQVLGTGFTLDTEPSGAVVFVNDRRVSGTTPVQVTDLDPGRHNVRVEHGDRYAPWRTQISVEADQIMAIPVAMLTLRTVAVTFRSTPSGARVVLERGSERRQLGTTPHTADVDITGGDWTVRMTRSEHREWSQPLQLEADDAEQEVAANLESRGTTNESASARSGENGASRRQAAGSRPARTTRPGDTTRTRAPAPVPVPAAPAPTQAAAPRAAATGPGTLMVNTTPWSMVTVDGRLVGNTPQRSISLSAGRHVVTLVNPDFNIRAVRRVNIRAGETTRLIVTLTPGQ